MDTNTKKEEVSGGTTPEATNTVVETSTTEPDSVVSTPEVAATTPASVAIPETASDAATPKMDPVVTTPEVAQAEPVATPVEKTEPEVAPTTTPLPAPEHVEILPAVTATATMRPRLTPLQRTWVAFIAGVLVTLGGWYIYQYVTTADTKEEMGAATEKFPAIVARINDDVITGVDLEQGIAQTEGVAISQGVDVSTPEAQQAIQQQALDVLTNTRLLVQVATKEGETASEDEVSAQIAVIEEQFGGKEALMQQAASLGLTNEDLRKDIKEQIIVDNYLRSNINVDGIEISAEEIQTVYDELTAQGQELPPLENISEAIKAQLVSQKQQEAIGALIDTLRQDADIEILI